MHPWVGLVCAVIATLAGLLTGPGIARWSTRDDVVLPILPTALTACIGGYVVGAQVGPVPALAAFEVFAVGAAILVGIDVRLHRLPDRLTASAAVAGIVLLAAAAAADSEWADFGRAMLGGLALLVVYLLLYLAVRSGLGGGDVKLAGVLGLHLAWLGWPTLVIGTVAGFAAGGLLSLGLLAARRATMKTRVPFGPAMVAGALFAIAVGVAPAAAALGW